jgi:hypothetical protein
MNKCILEALNMVLEFLQMFNLYHPDLFPQSAKSRPPDFKLRI